MIRLRRAPFLLLFLLTACEPPPPSLRVIPGALFPKLQLTTLNGERSTTAKYSGKAQVINVWATWCAPCRKELPALDRLADSLDPEKFVVYGVSIDSDDHLVREFLIDRKVRFTSYIDAQQHMTNGVLGVRVFPSTFLVGTDGKLREVVEGAREWDSAEWVQRIKALAEAHP